MTTVTAKPHKVTTFLASPVGDKVIRPLIIEAKKVLKSDLKTLTHWSERHEAEGRKIADALLTHLPGGTLDQVLRFLHEAAASRLIVAHGPVKPMRRRGKK